MDMHMAKPIRPIRVNHINVVLEDFEVSRAHFCELYGAEHLKDLPSREWNACLFSIGRTIFEQFSPHDFLLNARYGPHYVGIEYEADMDDVRAAVEAHGLRIIRELGIALHTHPADSFGVSFEFFGDGFHERKWDLTGGELMKPAEYWRDEHPLGVTGLKGPSIAVADIDAALRFMKSFVGAEPVYEAPRPAVAGRAVGLHLGDAGLEFLTPTGDGPLAQHLHRMGDGIRSTVFQVRDIERAKGYFAERGVGLVPGDADGAWAVPAKLNRGVMFEFTE
jgi:catechol 2,3-dioxygenase-like lactoylglutathione lyase family enzyme